MTRAVGLGKESTYGEDVAITKWISAIDENFAYDNQLIGELEMGYLGIPKPMPGPFKVSGGWKQWVEPENIGLILLALFGSVTTTIPSAGEYKHTFVPSATKQYLTAAVVTDVTAGQKTHPGYAVKKVKLSLAPGQKLLAEIDGFAKTLNIDALGSPSFSTLNPMSFHEGDAKIATVSDTDIKALSLEIEHLFAEDEVTIGDRALRYASPQGYLFKGTMDRLFETLTELKNFLGSGTPVAPATTMLKQQLDLNIDTGVLINGVTNYQMNIQVKEAIFKTHKANISKQDRTIENLEFEAFVPSSGNQATIDLYNAVVSY